MINPFALEFEEEVYKLTPENLLEIKNQNNLKQKQIEESKEMYADELCLDDFGNNMALNSNSDD